MSHPTSESESSALRLDFDRRLKLEFNGFNVTSDAGPQRHRRPTGSITSQTFRRLGALPSWRASARSRGKVRQRHCEQR
jgi:hypothetical protein